MSTIKSLILDKMKPLEKAIRDEIFTRMDYNSRGGDLDRSRWREAEATLEIERAKFFDWAQHNLQRKI